MIVQHGNKKLGRIPNVSLVPLGSCINTDHCKDLCYALRLMMYRPTARKSWVRNLRIARGMPGAFFAAIKAALYNTRLFRIHVAGDYFSRSYFGRWLQIATDHPGVKFLSYTRSPLALGRLPNNFILYASVFPGETPVRSDLPIAFSSPGMDPHVFGSLSDRASKAYQCKHDRDKTPCDVCQHCFTGEDVIFELRGRKK